MLNLPLCVAVASILLFDAKAFAADLTGRVVGVHDGDTITVLDASQTQHKIRLAGIDAPELKQAFGSKSKEHLSDLVYRKQVAIDWTKRDKYGRIVGKVLFIPDLCATPACLEKTDANYQQIAAGMAWHYKQYAKEQTKSDRDRYATVENQARAAKRGLWADAEPVAPWDWRHKQ